MTELQSIASAFLAMLLFIPAFHPKELEASHVLGIIGLSLFLILT